MYVYAKHEEGKEEACLNRKGRKRGEGRERRKGCGGKKDMA